MRKSKQWWFIVFALSISAVTCGNEPPSNNAYEDGITLTIDVQVFDPKAHIIKTCGDESCLFLTHPAHRNACLAQGWPVCLIDGKIGSGKGGKIPQYEVKSLIFEKNGKKVALDVTSMYDPWVENFNMKKHVRVLPKGKDRYQVTGYFGNEEYPYVCQWLVTLDGSIRTAISGLENIYTLSDKMREDFNLERDVR